MCEGMSIFLSSNSTMYSSEHIQPHFFSFSLHQLIHHRIQKMKEQVQELHRDITRRKCLSKKEAVSDIVDECSQVDIQINTQVATLEHMKIVFQRVGR